MKAKILDNSKKKNGHAIHFTELRNYQVSLLLLVPASKNDSERYTGVLASVAGLELSSDAPKQRTSLASSAASVCVYDT